MATVKERKTPTTMRKTLTGIEYDREFLVSGVDSHAEALASTSGPDYLPDVGDSYTTGGIELQCASLSTTHFEDDRSNWIVTATYKEPVNVSTASNSDGAGITTFVFNTSTEMKHIYQGLTDTPQAFAAPGYAEVPDEKGLIGNDGEKVQGLDVPSGVFEFGITRRYTGSEIDIDYILELARKPYTVNQSAWEEWEAGEVLFKTVSGRCTSGGTPTVIGDDIGQFGGFDKVTGVTAENSFNGMLFVSLEKIVGNRNFNIIFYKDSARTKQVGIASWATIGGENKITGQIGGRIPLSRYLFDTSIPVVKFPMPWEITYNFAISPNVLSQYVGLVPVTNKQGWDYADVRHFKKADAASGGLGLVEQARYVYVHKIFERSSFDYIKASLDDIFES